MKLEGFSGNLFWQVETARCDNGDRELLGASFNWRGNKPRSPAGNGVRTCYNKPDVVLVVRYQCPENGNGKLRGAHEDDVHDTPTSRCRGMTRRLRGMMRDTIRRTTFMTRSLYRRRRVLLRTSRPPRTPPAFRCARWGSDARTGSSPPGGPAHVAAPGHESPQPQQ